MCLLDIYYMIFVQKSDIFEIFHILILTLKVMVFSRKRIFLKLTCKVLYNSHF